jgi:hypothetical protein
VVSGSRFIAATLLRGGGHGDEAADAVDQGTGDELHAFVEQQVPVDLEHQQLMGGDQGEVAAVGGDGHGQDPALAGAEQHYWAAQLVGGPVDGVGSS